MNNNSPKFNPLTLFGFGGGLVIMVGGIATGNTALTALGLLGGGGMGATGIVLQNKSQEQTNTPLPPQNQTTFSGPPPQEPMKPEPTSTSKVESLSLNPQPTSGSEQNQAGEFFDYFLPTSNDKAEVINRLNIFFSKQDLIPQFCDRSGNFEEAVTVTLPDGEKRLVADIITEYKGRPKPPLFFDSSYRIRFIDRPGNVVADFVSPLILMVEGILLKLPNKEEFQYFDWEEFQDIYMIGDGDSPVMDFHFCPHESDAEEAHLCMEILTSGENDVERQATSLFCYFLARRFWQMELSSPKTSTNLAGIKVTSVNLDMNKVMIIDKQEIPKLIKQTLADDSLDEEAFQELVAQIKTKKSPLISGLKTIAYLENDQPIYLDIIAYLSESENKDLRINMMQSLRSLWKLSETDVNLFIGSSEEFVNSAFVLNSDSNINSVAKLIVDNCR
ncbi:DUF1720 domain-containing protein [Synechocystis salina LEGE 06155]|nr:DUF1720 domain-containing protein [Synechocystis salina LEGE 06155]